MSQNGPKVCLPSDNINVKDESNVRFLIYSISTNDEVFHHDDNDDNEALSYKDFLRSLEPDHIKTNLNSLVAVRKEILDEVNRKAPIITLEKLDLSRFDYNQEKDVYLINPPPPSRSPPPPSRSPPPPRSVVARTSSPSFDSDYSNSPNIESDQDHQIAPRKPISIPHSNNKPEEEFLCFPLISSTPVVTNRLNRNNESFNFLNKITQNVRRPFVIESRFPVPNQLSESVVPEPPNRKMVIDEVVNDDSKINLSSFVAGKEEILDSDEVDRNVPIIPLEKLDLSRFDYNQEKDVYLINPPPPPPPPHRSPPPRPVVATTSLPSCDPHTSSYSSSESGSSSSDDDSDSDSDYQVASLHSQSTLSEFDDDDDESICLERYQKPASISMYLGETLPYEPDNYFTIPSSRASSASSYSSSLSVIAANQSNRNQAKTLNSLTTSSELTDSLSDSSSMNSCDLLHRQRKIGNVANSISPYEPQIVIHYSTKRNRLTLNSITTASDISDSFSDSSSRKIGETSSREPERFVCSSSGVSSTSSSSVINPDIPQRNKLSINSITTASDFSDSCSDSSSMKSWDILTKKRKIGLDELITLKKARLV